MARSPLTLETRLVLAADILNANAKAHAEQLRQRPEPHPYIVSAEYLRRTLETAGIRVSCDGD